MPSILKHRHNGRAKPDDLESGPSSPTSPTHDDHKEEPPKYEGEEYDVLLRYAKDQAELASKGGAEEDEDEEGEGQRKRVWYAPWRTVKVESDKERKVCGPFLVPPFTNRGIDRCGPDPSRLAPNGHEARAVG